MEDPILYRIDGIRFTSDNDVTSPQGNLWLSHAYIEIVRPAGEDIEDPNLYGIDGIRFTSDNDVTSPQGNLWLPHAYIEIVRPAEISDNK
ncbi:hypothetical protein CEXT_254771 [Caerostris extrusa]|uniref:Uncharacterized protein n=1 Tax=Caerostris extrusa TaxID=172846 RepID=A0AAV4Q246_CAEEX|nr:hypothetical protein CEXT_254771 [Caerostris extrusa]